MIKYQPIKKLHSRPKVLRIMEDVHGQMSLVHGASQCSSCRIQAICTKLFGVLIHFVATSCGTSFLAYWYTFVASLVATICILWRSLILPQITLCLSSCNNFKVATKTCNCDLLTSLHFNVNIVV